MENLFKLSEDGKTLIKVLSRILNHITIPSGVEVIGKEAFAHYKVLLSVDIPETVTKKVDGTAIHFLFSLPVPA